MLILHFRAKRDYYYRETMIYMSITIALEYQLLNGLLLFNISSNVCSFSIMWKWNVWQRKGWYEKNLKYKFSLISRFFCFQHQYTLIDIWWFMCQVPEFEETAFSASLNKVVRGKTKFGWHLLQVLSERYV